MVEFVMNNQDRHKKLSILDYGGGGGQFALVLKSMFPKAEVFIVDMDDNALLDEFRAMNKQIKFSDFDSNKRKFDIIFMNDVFEHVTFPVDLLTKLHSKLNEDGRIFIDTPCHFWLYPLTKIFSRRVHKKLLEGTVSDDHQQIWSKKSFHIATYKARLSIVKFKILSEYTQGAEFYLKNMGIEYGLLKLCGKIFYFLAPLIARNKIMSVLISK